MSAAKGSKWVKINLTGVAHFMFNHKPAAPDADFDKPAMYKTEVEITDDSELRIVGDTTVYKGVDEIVRALKPLRIVPSNYAGTTRDGKDWERNNVVKFQSKVIDPEDAVKRKPISVDASGEAIPENGPLIGNGSFVEVRGSIPDYRITPPAAGRRPMLPTFDGVQVISLIEYIRPDNGAFKKREGYTVGSTPTATVVGEAKSDHKDDESEDVFAALERPSDLEPTHKPVENRVKKRA